MLLEGYRPAHLYLMLERHKAFQASSSQEEETQYNQD